MQYGIDQADVVYEEVVEGGITRLAAIFNSQAPDRVGPVRSVRKTDQSIVWPIGGIFAYSGGARVRDRQHRHRAGEAARRDACRLDDVPRPRQLAATRRSTCGRTSTRCSPRGGKPIPPPPLFVVPQAAARPPAERRPSAVSVGFATGFDTLWTWDAKSGTWLRTAGSSARPTTSTPRTCSIAPKNVVVMFVQYLGGAGRRAVGGGAHGQRPADGLHRRQGDQGHVEPARQVEAGAALELDGRRDPPDAGPDVGRAPRRRRTP